MKNLHESINNLTSLWKTAGTLAGRYAAHTHFYMSEVHNAQWPNRIWLKGAASDGTLKAIRHTIEQSQQPLAVSYWQAGGDESPRLFERNGFKTAFVQTGMSLHLTPKSLPLNRVQLIKVTSAEEASSWEALYPQSFGYVISAETITRTMTQIRYYLICLGDEAIGTVIAFETGSTIGIHGMGIIPAYRKQGFAEEAMLILLNLMVGEGKTRVTLQASGMGKNTYKNIGFAEDFLMTTYVLA